MSTATYTLKQLANMMQVNPATIRRAVERGEFPAPLPAFSRLRWSAAVIDAWMRAEEQRHGTAQ